VLSARALRHRDLPIWVCVQAEGRVRQTRFAAEFRTGQPVPHEEDVNVVVNNTRDLIRADIEQRMSLSALA
jgi:hypothetical protein